MKKNLKKWWKKFITVTPKEWKSLQKKCLLISTALGATWTTIGALPGVDLNGWGKTFAGAIAAFLFVGLLAQGHAEETTKK